MSASAYSEFQIKNDRDVAVAAFAQKVADDLGQDTVVTRDDYANDPNHRLHRWYHVYVKDDSRKHGKGDLVFNVDPLGELTRGGEGLTYFGNVLKWKFSIDYRERIVRQRRKF